jgi:hypothetical protein
VRLAQKDYALAVGDYTMALQLQNNLLQVRIQGGPTGQAQASPGQARQAGQAQAFLCISPCVL